MHLHTESRPASDRGMHHAAEAEADDGADAGGAGDSADHDADAKRNRIDGDGVGAVVPVCRACRAKRVDTEAQLHVLWQRVREDAQGVLGMEVPQMLAVSFFTGEASVADILQAGGAGAELGRFTDAAAGGRIQIRRHLPSDLAYETLAHELGHAWVAAHGRGGMPLLEEEGFCQWVSAKLLTARGMHRRRALLEARDDAFGRAYQAWRALERGGVNPVDMLRHH